MWRARPPCYRRGVQSRAFALALLAPAALPACAPGGQGQATTASAVLDAGPAGSALRAVPAPPPTPRPKPAVLEIPADLPDPFEAPPKATDPPPKPKGIQL